MIGFEFSKFEPQEGGTPFERLLEIFKELLMYTAGDPNEALSWLTELDKKYKLTTPDYGIADFIQELKDRGMLSEDKKGGLPNFNPTSKLEISLR